MHRDMVIEVFVGLLSHSLYTHLYVHTHLSLSLRMSDPLRYCKTVIETHLYVLTPVLCDCECLTAATSAAPLHDFV
jgi:hypothetical protein